MKNLSHILIIILLLASVLPNGATLMVGFQSVNGTLEMSRFEGGYFDEYGNPHSYLTDYQGNVVRVIDREGSGGQPMDYYPYGEPWVEWDWTLADTYSTFNKNRFLYGGKERITQFGLGLYNFEARMYRASLGRFSTPDKKAIDTPWLSPFAYCACNPVNAIDPDGNVVIFINGHHDGTEGGQTKYWNGVDRKIMNRIGDHHARYYDGALGGTMGKWFGTESNRKVENRYNGGLKSGYTDAHNIFSSLAENESIKIVTHSMGAAFGKGLIKGLQQYAKENRINIKNLIEMEIDLAPYQPTKQEANPEVPTITISHEGDSPAGNKPMPGAKNYVVPSSMKILNLNGHRIASFTQEEIIKYIRVSIRNGNKTPNHH